MNIPSLLRDLHQIIGENSIWADLGFALIVSALALFVGFTLYWFAHFIIGRLISQISKTWKNPIGGILLRRKVIKRACYFIVLLIFFKALPYILVDFPAWEDFFHRVLSIFNVYLFIQLIIASLWAVAEYQTRKNKVKMRPIKGLVQFIVAAIYLVGIIIIISLILNKSPMVLIGSLSAISAVLMLIFKDSILGFVAGIRISSNDMVRIGDWITVPKYNADGNVVDITLNTVKVRNFDNTIVTIPPYILISEAVVNWRGMQDRGTRRIQRTISIDSTTVNFISQDSVKKYQDIRFDEFFGTLKDAPETNIGLFRLYAIWYLNQRSDISKTETLMVRQTSIDDNGVPLEVYCFTTTSVWEEYEKIQAEIFEHLLSAIPLFGLAVYQRTAQKDERRVL
ncbi:MAG: mechanosensitive ion channel family protein [Bacteroidales bacterium]|jgi:miniconductance mechanosensitive channel|nr:mechanosensitive ion channel family protein [Bacteroidales bacterium]